MVASQFEDLKQPVCSAGGSSWNRGFGYGLSPFDLAFCLPDSLLVSQRWPKGCFDARAMPCMS